jgi:hypothetical protein
LVQYFAFIQFLCNFVDFAFAFGAFKNWPQKFGFFWTDLKFQNFRLGDDETESLKSQYRIYPAYTELGLVRFIKKACSEMRL